MKVHSIVGNIKTQYTTTTTFSAVYGFPAYYFIMPQDSLLKKTKQRIKFLIKGILDPFIRI